MIRRGVAFLEPENISIFEGSRVEELDQMQDVLFNRGLRVRMGYVFIRVLGLSLRTHFDVRLLTACQRLTPWKKKTKPEHRKLPPQIPRR